MLISSGQLSITTSPDSGSTNTQYIRGLCHQIIVKPENESTQYDVTITNPIGAVIYDRNSETGTLSELTQMPIHGIYTVEISNSSSAETFIIQIIIEE